MLSVVIGPESRRVSTTYVTPRASVGDRRGGGGGRGRLDYYVTIAKHRANKRNGSKWQREGKERRKKPKKETGRVSRESERERERIKQRSVKARREVREEKDDIADNSDEGWVIEETAGGGKITRIYALGKRNTRNKKQDDNSGDEGRWTSGIKSRGTK